MNPLKKFALALCGAILASASHAQEPLGKPAAQSVVTVSFNDAVLRTGEAQKALAALQAQFAPRQTQLQTLNDEVLALRKRFENIREETSDAERAASALTLDRKEKQLQRQIDEYKQDSQAESQRVFQTVAQKFFAFLQAYAQQHKYAVVIDRGTDAAPVVWYAADSMDISEQLIKAYDSQPDAAKRQLPAKPSEIGPTQTPGTLPGRPSPRPPSSNP
jgi:outer membrane protein